MEIFVSTREFGEKFTLPLSLACTRFHTPLKCKNEYLVLALGEETAVQAVVGSII